MPAPFTPEPPDGLPEGLSGVGEPTMHPGWRRRLWQAAGALAFAVGTAGIFLPLLPTVVFYILAAFCFGKSNPAWEAKLLADPRFGPHIVAWRERRAIARAGKIAAVLMMTVSGIVGLLFLHGPWRFAPAAAAVLVGGWILSRPDA